MKEARVYINNKEIDGIISLDIAYDLFCCSNSLYFSVPYIDDLQELFNGFNYPICSVYYGEKLIFEGYIETWQSITAQDLYLFQGRTYTSILCEPSTQIKNYNFENVSLGNIINTVAGEYKLKLKMPLGDTSKISYCQFTHNQPVYNQIMNYASKVSIKNKVVTVTTDFDGSLILGKNAIYEKTAVIDFIEDTTFDAKINLRGDLRKGTYIRYGQNLEDVSINYTLYDKKVKSKINRIDSRYSIGETVDELKNIASRDRALDIAGSSQIMINYRSWLDSRDNLLDIGKTVSLHLPKKFLITDELYIIEKLNLLYNKQGMHSLLKLSPINTFDIG